MRLNLNRTRREELTAWAFSAPALLLLLLFLIVPFAMAFGLAFTDQRLIPGPLPTRIIGLRNFVRLLDDQVFRKAILHNFIFALVVVPLQSGLALGLALLVNQKLRGVAAFRAIYFLPTVTVMVVVAVVWTFLYSTEGGLINELLRLISAGRLGPYRWLDDPRLAFPAIIILSIWQGVGFQMIIYLAGLQEIPLDLYEAASIDGAGRGQQFWYITMPALRNTHIFVLVTTTILAFKLFTQVEVMTQGGPLDATQTMVLHMVNMGYRQLKVGYASAISVIFVLIVLTISLIQRRLLVEEREVA